MPMRSVTLPSAAITTVGMSLAMASSSAAFAPTCSTGRYSPRRKRETACLGQSALVVFTPVIRFFSSFFTSVVSKNVWESWIGE